MAQIVINEISQNYTYNIGNNSYATVALPITAMWGPAYQEPESVMGTGATTDDMLEMLTWNHFPATQAGLESFVSTYRGPSSNYRVAGDCSYQMAMTLLTAGYDVLVCRVCPGTHASLGLHPDSGISKDKTFTITAKYPGTFGNNLKVNIKRLTEGSTTDINKFYWNLVVYIVDASGIQMAVENLIFRFNIENSTEYIPHISEVESNFLTFSANDITTDGFTFDTKSTDMRLDGGSDTTTADNATEYMNCAIKYANIRYDSDSSYIAELNNIKSMGSIDSMFAETQMYLEWVYSAAYVVYDLLQDKLNYNPQIIISPGWDDQDICRITGNSDLVRITEVSPLHKKIMETAYKSRCATGLIDIPRSEKRSEVYNESNNVVDAGYAQKLARYAPDNVGYDTNSVLFSTHSALFAPWGSYKYVGMNKQYPAPPSFLALLMQRAMILNQPLQYYWALPTNRRHNLKVGKMDYKVPKKLLDVWQKLEGVGVNIITEIPEFGLTIWGNSTLFEVPPATYQALANLSTRYLVNAVEDVAYKCGLSITYQYNNEQAYNKFYAGVTPLLDTMKNVEAIDDYYVKMAADINGLDQVNANTVIGKIYLVINGVINDIYIDLIALPPGVDLNQFKS